MPFGITRMMPITTSYSFGDVVLVPFPFTDQSASKKRPAVIVSADEYQRRRPDVIVMAVTSQILRPAGTANGCGRGASHVQWRKMIVS